MRAACDLQFEKRPVENRAGSEAIEPEGMEPEGMEPEVMEPEVMESVVTSLELGRDVFDSAETRILSAAFAKAWTYVQFDPALGALDASERQSELARALMTILKFGDTNPTSLANSGIALLRMSQRSRVQPGRLQ